MCNVTGGSAPAPDAPIGATGGSALAPDAPSGATGGWAPSTQRSGASGNWAPSALPTGSTAKADVGGTLKIRIDQEGRARVAEVKSNNPDVDYSVYTGMSMAGA